MFKYEIHLHTRACSACAVSTGTEMVDAAIERGYSGFVITNHFYHGNTCVDRNLPWEDFIDAYANDYLLTKEYADKMGINVFFGLEEGFAPGKEMLIYGISPEIYKKNPEFIMMSANEKSSFVRKNGGFAVCAHPFRKRDYIPEPDKEPCPQLFDGIECYNHFNAPEENERAFLFAQKNSLVMTSGGDVHRAKDFGKAGIAFEKKITTDKELIENIKLGNFKLLSPF